MRRSEYSTKGVILNPPVPAVGDKVRLTYNGLLAKSGATELFAHVGFGSGWSNIADHKMTKTSDGFEAVIPVSTQGELNVCFKDAANNWDNNSGSFYSFSVE